MKKILTLLPVLFILYQPNYSQTIENTGKPVAEIFTDFHFNIKDTTKTTGFGLNRAYLGYNFLPVNNFSGSVIINIGSPDDLSADATPRRYAFFREASITWKNENINVAFGITTTRLYDFQQKFWGKRYIANTYQSINGYGFVADLGVVVDYKFNDIFKADFTLMNGEGYSELQLDNGVKASAGLIFTPVKQFAVRLYGDIDNVHGKNQYTLLGFSGFKNELITFGIEASFKSNLDLISGHNAWGLSGTGSISVAKNTEIFARCDYSTSVKAPGEIVQWNNQLDGTFSVFGVQYSFTQNIKFALDYQGTYPFSNSRQNENLIYVNVLYKF